ncbi:MAG: glycoside hydrolase family 3 C-terminal domain-containing protein [Chloroflexota bacterium]|nr:glycoside hydrolase family 3 C-terminal domain-containing protein [Chloroflexota bacterium]
MNAHDEPRYKDPTAPIEERVEDLISRMTLEEKVSQMVHDAAAIERLDVPAYNWWNECLHGVARAGVATVFPQAIGMAATWDTQLIGRMARATSDEARAKHHEALRQDVHDIYTGLTFWSPNINIFRDPRWGRGQETYGEDPYLMGRMAVAFIEGLQGDDPHYLKVVATAKHYVVHSGPEEARHHFNAQASARDMRETYLPAFEAAVREAGVESVMGAYNRTNGEPCCASPTLLGDILRDEWGFDGYVVSDCGAIRDIHEGHQVVDTPEEAAALAVKEGCDLNCGEVYAFLLEALEQGLIDEETIDRSLQRLFRARFRLGMFDPPEMVDYARIPYSVNDCAAHRELALKVAQESMVLLKNADDLLPLSKELESVAVVGPNADDVEVLLGNYNGTPSAATTPLQGIREIVSEDTTVRYAQGCSVTGTSTEGFPEAVTAAEEADVVIACVGISQEVEGEEGAGAQADRTELTLPGVQDDLLKAVYETGTPLVVVLINGGALAVNWAQAHASAILEAWYPGEEGGTAIAQVLFGDYNPAGRLPVTFYTSVEQLPLFEDYAMAGRTYRFMEQEPLYPFGYGLSYTTYAYDDLRMPARIKAGEEITVSARVRNTGDRAGDEVVQLYLRDDEATFPVPLRHLEGFERLYLAPGEAQRVSFTLTPDQMVVYDDEGNPRIEPGTFTVSIGGGQPIAGGAADYVKGQFEVE